MRAAWPAFFSGTSEPAAAAHGLAVDRDVREAQGVADGVDPVGEAVLESQRVQRGEDPVEGIMGRGPLGSVRPRDCNQISLERPKRAMASQERAPLSLRFFRLAMP